MIPCSRHQLWLHIYILWFRNHTRFSKSIYTGNIFLCFIRKTCSGICYWIEWNLGLARIHSGHLFEAYHKMDIPKSHSHTESDFFSFVKLNDQTQSVHNALSKPLKNIAPMNWNSKIQLYSAFKKTSQRYFLVYSIIFILKHFNFPT